MLNGLRKGTETVKQKGLKIMYFANVFIVILNLNVNLMIPKSIVA